jgi:hypothetical protein
MPTKSIKLTPEQITQATATAAQGNIATLARMCKTDWRNPYFGAKPYLDAMLTLDKVTDDYGMDSGKSIVTYFLGNAQTWRGDVARIVKAELNKRIK